MIIGAQRPLDRSSQASARPCIDRIHRIVESVRLWGNAGDMDRFEAGKGERGAKRMQQACTSAHRCRPLISTTRAGPSGQAAKNANGTIPRHSSEDEVEAKIRVSEMTSRHSTAHAPPRLDSLLLFKAGMPPSSRFD